MIAVGLLAGAGLVLALILISSGSGDGRSDPTTTAERKREKRQARPRLRVAKSAAGPFHSPDRMPPASWRPFADDSPWNAPVPEQPQLHANSSLIVQRLLEAGTVAPLQVGDADTEKDFEHPVYFADRSDPLYTVSGGSDDERYGIDGKRVRLPDGAKPAAGTDGHLAVVYEGEHWGCYQAVVNRRARSIHCDDGRRVPIDGAGIHAAETSARFPSLGGRVRYQELAAGRIEHALFATSSQIAFDAVYPADKSDGDEDPREGYPPMGTRFQLDPAYMTDERLATYLPWKRALLRAIRDYGFYLGDTTSRPLNVFPIESGTSYTSFGIPDPWVRYAKRNELPSSFHDEIQRELYRFDVADSVDWTQLRVIDPCVSAGDC
jgi:hypothetical protein